MSFWITFIIVTAVIVAILWGEAMGLVMWSMGKPKSPKHIKSPYEDGDEAGEEDRDGRCGLPSDS